MPLAPTVLHVPAGRGIDEATRDEHLEIGQANRVNINARMDRRGSLITRPGFRKQTAARLDGTTRSEARKLFGRGTATCIVGNGVVDTYSPTKTVNGTAPGRPSNINVERYVVAAQTDVTNEPSIASAGGLYFVATLEADFTSLNSVNVHLFDPTSRIVIKTFVVLGLISGVDTRLATPARIKLVAVGNTVGLIYNTSASNIAIKTLDATSSSTINAGWSAAANIVTNWTGDDFDAVGMETKIAVVYTGNTGTLANKLWAVTVNPSTRAVVTSNNPLNTSANLNVVACDGSESDFLWIAWARSDNANMSVVGFNPSTLAVSSTTAVAGVARANAVTRLGIRRTNSTSGYVTGKGLTDYDGHWNQAMSRPFHDVAGTCTPTDSKMDNWGWTPTFQPFVIDSRAYSLQGASADATSPKNLILFDITAADVVQVTASATTSRGPVRPVAAPARGLCSYGQQATISCQHTIQISSTKAIAAVVVQYNSVDAAVEIVEFDTTLPRYNAVEHNAVTYLDGGLLCGYDGQGVFEANFVCPPSLRVVDGGGVGLLNGTYLYTAIVEWTDAEGNVHWSEPAPAQTITLANRLASYTFLGYSASIKDALGTRFIRTKIFRTKNGGGAYYLLATLSGPYMGAAATFTDNATDATIGANAKLYTQAGLPGAAQFRRCPPAAVAVESYLGSVILLAEDRKTIWMSSQRVVGEGLWFNDIWQYPVEGGPLQALAELDGQLYIFSRRAIYVTSGDPPADNGAGGLGPIRRLASDVGCIDVRSIAKTSAGIFFRSERGIEILGRDGSVSWIGEKVRQTVDANPTITSAVVNAAKNDVIFSLATGESGGLVTGTGPRVVFNMSAGEWTSTDQVKGNGGVANTPAQSAAIVHDGTSYVYGWLQADGTVHMERSDSWLDDDTYFVPVTWEPAIVKAGLQQQQELWQYVVLHAWQSAAGYTIDHAYNYSSSFGDTRTVTEALALSDRQIEFRPKPQSPAVAIRLTTTAPAVLGTGQGLAIIGASFDVASIQTPTRGTPHLAIAARK